MPDRDRERTLALAWQHAASAINRYDSELFEVSEVKALGWADPKEWERSAVTPEKLKLDIIIQQCRHLKKER